MDLPTADAARSFMRAALLVNPAAGSVPSAPGFMDRLAAALREAGYVLALPPRPDRPLDEQITAALAVGPQVAFAIGGDGTIRAVAERLAGLDILLGVLPGGTMNRLAARLGLPGDPESAARSLAGAEVEALAMGTLNGNVFLYQSIAGRPSRLVRFREMQRGVGLRGWLPLLRAALRAVSRPPRRSLRLRDDGETIRADAVVVTLPRPGETAAFRIDAVRRGGMLTGLRQAWRWIRGRLAEDEGVASFSRALLAVHGRDRMLRVTLDGEQMLLAPPLRYRLRTGGLRVLRPRRG